MCGLSGEDVVPFGIKENHIWLHPECWYEKYEGIDMQNGQFPPSGRLFSNNKKRTPKAPDVTGKLEISSEVLDHLVRSRAAGRPIVMELAGWRKQSRTTSGSWYSLSASVPYSERQEASQAPASPGPSMSLDDELSDEIPF